MCFPFPKGREIFGEFYLVKSSTSQEGKKEEKMVLFLAFGMMTSGIAIYGIVNLTRVWQTGQHEQANTQLRYCQFNSGLADWAT